MNDESQNLALGEAASRFLGKLPPGEREASQREVHRFVRWYGSGRPFSGLTAPEVANYAERLSSSDTDYLKKFEMIHSFLAYGKKAGWSKTNLATHLKVKKTKSGRQSAHASSCLPDTIPLTRQGFVKLEAELADLKNRRENVIDDMRRAAADKDFRENAPLDAAREERGHIEGRIIELEQTLKTATVINEDRKPALKAVIGTRVVLCDLASGEELRYMIVSPREVDVTRGKISSASPIGKVLIGRGEGEIVEVAAPAGKLRYQLKRVER